MQRLVIAAAMALVAIACSSNSFQSPAQQDAVVLPLQVTPGTPGGDANIAKSGGTLSHESVHLSGDQEPFTPAVPGGPTPADSHGQGQAIIRIASDDLSFDYKLIASNIENITQAHIHCGSSVVSGPIMIWLYPSVTSTATAPNGAGRHDGVLAEGTVKSGVALNVRTVATTNAFCPGGVANFAEALAKIRAGQAYVNVHTNDGVGATNTGPGDFPGGEIRGQLFTH